MSIVSIISEDSEHIDNDGFYSFPIKDYNREECLQLAHIRIWNGQILHLLWCPDKNEIIIENDDDPEAETIVQPDDAHIIRSLAHLCGSPAHQIRFSHLVYFSRDGAPVEQPGDDAIYHLYDADWRSYGEEGICFQVIAEIDFEAEEHFIPPITDEICIDSEIAGLDHGLNSMVIS